MMTRACAHAGVLSLVGRLYGLLSFFCFTAFPSLEWWNYTFEAWNLASCGQTRVISEKSQLTSDLSSFQVSAGQRAIPLRIQVPRGRVTGARAARHLPRQDVESVACALMRCQAIPLPTRRLLLQHFKIIVSSSRASQETTDILGGREASKSELSGGADTTGDFRNIG
jgi:hypothetical protein